MAVSADPLNRASIAVVSKDTGDRFSAPKDNTALRLARALGDAQPAINQTLGAIADTKRKEAEERAKAAALEASGAPLADAVRMGKIKATQNPWFIDAYERESAAIRGQDALGKLQTAAASWEERSDPEAFAERWRKEVGALTEQFSGNPNSIKGFTAAEAQATQQTLASNQAFNTQRIMDERKQNVSILAADALKQAVVQGGGAISGSAAALALEPAKQQWIATGGSLDDWNNLMIAAVTTASYSISSPGLLDLLKDPALLQGPREGDDSSYGDGGDGETPDLPEPLKPVQPEGEASSVSTVSGPILAPPVMGRVSKGGTFSDHGRRGSAGVDIAAPIGSKVTTPISGKVRIGHDERSGLFVAIDGDDGRTYTSFSHLGVASVQNGERVSAGTAIGRVGMTGKTTGPHVHWRVKVDGKDVDPMSYEVQQQASDEASAQAAAGNQPDELAPLPESPQASPPLTVMGASLYDMAGVADKVESDRYRIRSALNSEAGDRLQAQVNERRLQGLEATDRLYATYGTRLLEGDVTGEEIIRTLQAGGYSPQVIAEAMSNVRGAVTDTQGLANARLGILGNDPQNSKRVFELATEGRTSGYSEDYERRVGEMVVSGEISASDGITMVGNAVSRSETLSDNARQAATMGNPGQIIRKATDVNRAIDQYTSLAIQNAQRMFKQVLGEDQSKTLKSRLKVRVLSYLADNPGDFAGAEQAARDFVATYLKVLQSRKGQPRQQPSQQPASGGNPRR